MATEATRNKLETLRDVNRSHISRFTIPSVGATTSSAVYSMDTGVREGKIQTIRVSSDSGSDFDVIFKAIEAADDFSVDEVFRIEGVDDEGVKLFNLGIHYSNDDEFANPDEDDPFFGGELTILYVQIKNDAGTPTGDIQIELVIESGD
jgi:hypothetical protein